MFLNTCYKKLLRPLLFCLEPETAHQLTMRLLPYFGFLLPQVTNCPCTVMGLHFKNPIGLAAGFDKNAAYLPALAQLGFGFIEVGTVTPLAQPGRPKPRLFRLKQEKALINRLGFNNDGVVALLKNIRASQYQGILGINIGKNASTPIENAAADYLTCFEQVYPYADYITVNISSPNTEKLRQLQSGQAFAELLATLKTKQLELQQQSQRFVPLVIKISPDLTQAEIQEIAEQLLRFKVDGVIATNTTILRPDVEHAVNATEEGGLSGAPLLSSSTAVVTKLKEILGDKIPIIAVGGVMSAANALAKFNAGAKLVQLYTGLIYQGPGLIAEIANELTLQKSSAIPAIR